METTKKTSDDCINEIQFSHHNLDSSQTVQGYNGINTSTCFSDSSEVYTSTAIPQENSAIVKDNILDHGPNGTSSDCSISQAVELSKDDKFQDNSGTSSITDKLDKPSITKLNPSIIIDTVAIDKLTVESERGVPNDEDVATVMFDDGSISLESEIIGTVQEIDVPISTADSLIEELESSLESSHSNPDEICNVTSSGTAEIIEGKTHHKSSLGEIDESVSLPPAEPPILSNENIILLKEEKLDHSIEEVVTEASMENEIEISEDHTTEVDSTDNVNIQYTVLPPGENSVYQEDGTLVVEYPLDEDIGANKDESQETTELIESSVEVETEDFEQEEVVDAKEEKVFKTKGRKSSGQIPLHILGHNIDKPVQDVPNGGGVLKPRLGVKIPYRKLSSQIVSTTELQQQIVERARLKQESQNNTSSSLSFAKKLTHRLAQSLSGKGRLGSNKQESKSELKLVSITDSGNKETQIEAVTSAKPVENVIDIQEHVVLSTNHQNILSTNKNDASTNDITEPFSNQSKDLEHPDDRSDHLQTEFPTVVSNSEKTQPNIESNSDLIAILEGDGEEGSSLIEITKPLGNVDVSDISSEITEIEKEISLSEHNQNQTQQVKGKKFFKSRDNKVSNASKDKISLVYESKIKNDSCEGAGSMEMKDTSNDGIKHKKQHISSTGANSETNTIKNKEKERSGAVVEVEPMLKPAMVLKTYTRKRKINDTSTPEQMRKPLIPPALNQPDPKIDFVAPIPPNVYVTKSSRIIKKKVIWDPDEALPSVRNQSKVLSKMEAPFKVSPQTITKNPTAKTTERKSFDKDKQPYTPRPSRSSDKKSEKATVHEKETKVFVPEKPVFKKSDKTEALKKNVPSTKSSPINKCQSDSPKMSSTKSPKKNTKKLSEIDKLLMDEGAVNMLYDLNNSDDQKRRGSSRIATTVPNDKAQIQKDLLNRAQEVKKELTQGRETETTSPKVLRKKEGTSSTPLRKDVKEATIPSAIRKMSKDSSRSSVHSPPPSPDGADASRIIRRHSSSSFSSIDDSGHDTLMDSEEKDKDKQTKKRIVPSKENLEKTIVLEDTSDQSWNKDRPSRKKAITGIEVPPRKKLKKNNSNVDVVESIRPVEITVKFETGDVTGEVKTDPTKAFTVIKMNKHFMINLTYSGCENYLTIQLLKDLTVTLTELGRNKNCNAVSVHSQGNAFCLGLDYKGLVESNEDLRKRRATELSSCVREFLKCLLYFPKVLVAGIKGDCVGFGVTMLPLFDIIVASDTANFRTPYSKLGSAPEGGFLLSVPFQTNHALASELLYTTQRMNADEAQRRGLVTKLFWPEKFDIEFRALLSHISNLSKAGLMATKKTLRLLHFQSVEPALVKQCKQLVDVWISEECQRNFTNYSALTFDIDQ